MAKREEWERRIAMWRSSGLTAAEFAAREGLTKGTLKWWANQLRVRATVPKLARVVVASGTSTKDGQFAKVKLELSVGEAAALLQLMAGSLAGSSRR